MLAKKHCDGMCSAVCRSTREIGGANIHKGVQDKNETRFDRREFGVAGEWRGKSGNEEGGGGSNSQRTQAEKTLFPLSGDRPHLLAGFRDSADKGHPLGATGEQAEEPEDGDNCGAEADAAGALPGAPTRTGRNGEGPEGVESKVERNTAAFLSPNGS